MSNSDEVILNGIFEKLKRTIPISKEEFSLWWNWFLSTNISVSSASEEEFAGMQANLQNQLRRKFLGGNQ